MVGRRQRVPRKVLEVGAGGHIGEAESRPTARVSGLWVGGLMAEVDKGQVMRGPCRARVHLKGTGQMCLEAGCPAHLQV